MNTIEIIEYAERLLDARGLPMFDDAQGTFAHVNSAYFKVARRFSNFDAGYFTQVVSYAWTAPVLGRATYVLPVWFSQAKLLEVLDQQGQSLGVVYPGDPIQIAQDALDQYPVYFTQGRNLVLDFSGGAFAGPSTLRLTMHRVPAGLVAFKPSAVGGTTITLPALPLDGMGKMRGGEVDYYAGAEFEITRGPGAGERIRIASNTSAGVATLAGGASTTATTDSVLVSVPEMPEDAHALLANFVALEGVRVERSSRAYQMLRDEVASDWEEMLATNSVRQVQASRIATPQDAT